MNLKKALEYIKSKHNGEIPYKYGANECAKLMEGYAEQYIESKLIEVKALLEKLEIEKLARIKRN